MICTTAEEFIENYFGLIKFIYINAHNSTT